MSDKFQLVIDDIYDCRPKFESRLSDKSINFEQEAGFAVQQLMRNEYTAKVALSARQSVINAVTNIAAIGISLNPAKKQAYLVPRENQICLDISYMGLMDLAQATGSILWAQAKIVHANDRFSTTGYESPPIHEFNPFASKESRGEIVGVYVVVKTADGAFLTHTMAIEEVYAIRDRSQGWRSGKTTPWKTDEGEMIKKTCVKQAYKYWPKTARLDEAIHYLNEESGEGIDFKQPPALPVSDENYVDPAVFNEVMEQLNACQSKEEARSLWKEALVKLKQNPEYRSKFKTAFMEKGEQLPETIENKEVENV